MFAKTLLPVLGAVAVNAFAQQGAGYPPPAPSTLSTVMSGVLPVLPTSTPFNGVETLEGAIVYDGPANPSFLPVLGVATTATALPAATYVAKLPSYNFLGMITISSTSGGSGVSVSVDFTGFPSEAEYGPFIYHVHNLPVPASGDCTETLGHLDPTDRGEYYPCNAAAPDSCQVGDLSGKHGNITAATFISNSTDPFLSANPNSPAFFGDKSIVIHTSNVTRITCANFTLVSSSSTSGANASSSGASSSSSSSASATTSAVAVSTGAASKISAFGVAGMVAAAAFFL